MAPKRSRQELSVGLSALAKIMGYLGNPTAVTGWNCFGTKFFLESTFNFWLLGWASKSWSIHSHCQYSEVIDKPPPPVARGFSMPIQPRWLLTGSGTGERTSFPLLGFVWFRYAPSHVSKSFLYISHILL